MGGADGGATQRALEGDVIVTAMNPRALMKKNSAFPLLANRSARRRGHLRSGQMRGCRSSSGRVASVSTGARLPCESRAECTSVGGALRADDAWLKSGRHVAPGGQADPAAGWDARVACGWSGTGSRRLLLIC